MPCWHKTSASGQQCSEQKPDLEKALQRLQDGFKFVGLTEYWEASVCLFHAMFGGECDAMEFENTRPGPTTQQNRGKLAEYDVSVLKG